MFSTCMYTVCTCTYSVYRPIQFEASLALYIHCIYTGNTCIYNVCTKYIHVMIYIQSVNIIYTISYLSVLCQLTGIFNSVHRLSRPHSDHTHTCWDWLYTIISNLVSVYRSIQFEASLALYIHCMYTSNTCTYNVCTCQIQRIDMFYDLHTVCKHHIWISNPKQEP